MLDPALEFKKRPRVYPSAGKGCQSCFLRPFNPRLRSHCGNCPAAATARQLWQTNSNPRTKGENIVKDEEAIICLTAFASKDVGVLLSDAASIFRLR